MKFKKYVKESITPTGKLLLDESFLDTDHNVDRAPSSKDEIDAVYAPVKELIEKGDFEQAKKELDALEADLDDFEETNSKKKFFKFPQFMIDGQRKRIAALRAELPKNESINDMDKRCERCNTLLNDSGTCPKCDDGEEDYGDELKEEMSVRDKLKAAYPELNFDKTVTEDHLEEELSNKEKLKRAYPELNFDTNFQSHDLDNKLLEDHELDNLDYDDEYEMDDVEQDRVHAALYGGDRMYCDCGAKLCYDEWGSYCPVCDAEEVELNK